MSDLGKIEGKTFLITGGASGLGAGYAQAFLENGAQAVAILDISEEAGKATSEKLNTIFPGKVIFLKCDVGNEESITEAFNDVVDKFKTIDVIINNAGIMNDLPDVWRHACEVNYVGTVSLTYKGLKHMRKDEGHCGGTIINISSVAALVRFPCTPAYFGAKAGIMHFSSCIAMDPFHERTGVRILTMCIGGTDTALAQNLEQRFYDKDACINLNQRMLSAMQSFQKPESVVKGLVEAFKKGTNESIWLLNKGKPAEDITPIIDQTFNVLKTSLDL